MKELLRRSKARIQVAALIILMCTFSAVLYDHGCFHRNPVAEVDCAQFIEELPEELYNDVNAACNEAVQREWVTAFEVRGWFNQNRTIYVERPFMFQSSLLGYIMPRANYYEFFVFPEGASDADQLTVTQVMRRRVAFHETIHIMLEIKGMTFDNDIHHAFMDENNVCPGRCPAGMVEY